MKTFAFARPTSLRTTLRVRAAAAMVPPGAALALLAGCASNLAEIDRKTEKLVLERLESVRGQAAPPSRAQLPADPPRTDWAYTTAPSTSNPAVEELSFTPADPARDVSARLDSYSQLIESTPGVTLDLLAAFRQGQLTGRELLSAEEDYVLSAIRLLIERHRWSPRLFNDTSVRFDAPQDDARFDSAVRVINELRATQRLPFGGQVEAAWLFNATEQLRDEVTGQYVQSSEVVLGATVPLLRGFGDVAREDLIQSERDLVYAARDFEQFRRDFLVSLARDYFSLLQQLASIENQKLQLQGVRELEARQRALVEAGRVREFEVNLARSNVLSTESSLASARERYALSLDQFKVRLGVPVTQGLNLVDIDFDLPEPDVAPTQAADWAVEYRLDLQNSRDRLDDRARAVRNARNQLLPDLNLAGNVRMPTDADEREGGAVYEPDDFDYDASVTFGLPLDREIERLQLRQSSIALENARRDHDQLTDRIILDARSRARQIDLQRFNLRLAEERVRINERRKEEQEIKREETTAQEIIDTEADLLSARNALSQAKTDLRNAVLDYLNSTGQLRVARDGSPQLLPGMNAPARIQPAPPPGGPLQPLNPDPADPQNPVPQG